MPNKRKLHTPEFKAKVSLAAIKELQTTSEIASQYQIHPVQISTWKKQAIAHLPEAFKRTATTKQPPTAQALTAPLYEEIGRLKMELDWLKKKSRLNSVDSRRSFIDPHHPDLSITRQCALIGISRSSYYQTPCGVASEENLKYMRLIDEQYLRTPFYGSRQMTRWLIRQGHVINRKRVQRLMRTMGIQGTVPGPHTSGPHPGHKVYPYLLQGLDLQSANLVWSTDITYIPMATGFMYLAAIIDWYSRYVIAWALSNTLDHLFCVSLLEEALGQAHPVIFNTDQGSQFTSTEFTRCLSDREILISMDGRGRALDNVFVERLWRSAKYEEIYLKDYQNVLQLSQGLKQYFHFYNHERPHSALEGATPAEIHSANEYRT
ncbi:MAG: IS3 family transposase [Candidatus Thiosymbion ectosymbiont of Robbea hypermnestra]|nr:IS3 family transposase [Candidatus Thiosymbion ectosymbiont of Robbea hypermnestra]